MNRQFRYLQWLSATATLLFQICPFQTAAVPIVRPVVLVAVVLKAVSIIIYGHFNTRNGRTWNVGRSNNNFSEFCATCFANVRTELRITRWCFSFTFSFTRSIQRRESLLRFLF